MKSALTKYFRLDVNLAELSSKEWFSKPKHPLCDALLQAKAARGVVGLRLLQQSQHEVLFSFICSQNNHVSRIASMVETLCKTYGSRVGDAFGVAWFAFPSLIQLTKAKEDDLRAKGFGYRAKYIVGSCEALQSRKVVLAPQARGFAEVRESLMKLPGVGRKVADCITLFSSPNPTTNGFEAASIVPFDIHMARITQRILRNCKLSAIGKKADWHHAVQDLQNRLKTAKPEATLTLLPKHHDALQQLYFEAFGPFAGWAHNYIFRNQLLG